MGFPNTELEVLRKYPKPVVHLRSQYHRKKLGLVFGAGLCVPLGFPNWEVLVKNIAKDSQVLGSDIVSFHKKKKTLASITQMLFHRYQYRRRSTDEFSEPITDNADKRIHSDWLRIVHKHLYCISELDRKRKMRTHPYIKEFVHIIKNTPMTVNYNFDDSLQKLLAKARGQEEELKSRGYETVWDSRVQFRQDKGVVFHPNGFLSERFNDNSSGSIIFSDESFGDQLIQTMIGGYTNLVNHFSRVTCLFIGISLDDSTLKHLLRQNSRENPGHYHYYVYHIKVGQNLSDKARKVIFEVNFEVYNLITLFLSDEGIRSLAKLIKRSEGFIQQFSDKNRIRIKFCYYIIGCVGVGKSTTISHIRSLCTYDEWFDEKPEVLSKEWEVLSRDERRRADDWVASQFYKKNWSLMKANEGIHVVDRTPLDPVTFTDLNKRKLKARKIRRNLDPDENGKIIVPGHVIFLDGGEVEIKSRLLRKHKDWKFKSIRKLQGNIKDIFDFEDVSTVDTRGRSIESVVREVSRTIHVSEYREIDLHTKLVTLERG